MRRKEWPALFVMAAVVVLAGCPDTRDEAPPATTPPATTPPAQQPAEPGMPQVDLPEGVTQEMVTQGQQIFRGQGNCFTCHGMNGEGTPLGPSMRDQDWIAIDGSFGSITDIVRTGVPSPQQYPAPMPPMGGAQLSDEQIRAVSAYVYAVSRGS